jgi:4-carboxymuconolactone decarboxylase
VHLSLTALRPHPPSTRRFLRKPCNADFSEASGWCRSKHLRRCGFSARIACRQKYAGGAKQEADMGDTKDAAFAAGMRVRHEMFGTGGAEQRYAQATDFNRPFEDLVTRYCFGDTWTRPGLDRKTRSLITLAALTALTKPNQLKVHIAGALANGCSIEEIRETILHTAVYAGVPCGVEAFNAAAETLARQAENKR